MGPQIQNPQRISALPSSFQPSTPTKLSPSKKLHGRLLLQTPNAPSKPSRPHPNSFLPQTPLKPFPCKSFTGPKRTIRIQPHRQPQTSHQNFMNDSFFRPRTVKGFMGDSSFCPSKTLMGDSPFRPQTPRLLWPQTPHPKHQLDGQLPPPGPNTHQAIPNQLLLPSSSNHAHAASRAAGKTDFQGKVKVGRSACVRARSTPQVIPIRKLHGPTIPIFPFD